MDKNIEMFQAIQNALPEIFQQSPGGMTMREARPQVENALKSRGFDPTELHKEVYRHIHQSAINVRKERAAYKGVRRVLWNDPDGTFRLLTAFDLAEVASGRPPQQSSNQQEVTKKGQLIARERIVRDYLACQLDSLEPGLKLWESGGRAVEHLIGKRNIDIFAQDAIGCPVIIELKLHMAHDRVIGQALHYRALVRKYHSVERVRIILVAEKISTDLEMAAQEIKDIQMYEYESLSLEGEQALELRFARKNFATYEFC